MGSAAARSSDPRSTDLRVFAPDAPLLPPAAQRYLDLLERCLTRSGFGETYLGVNPSQSRWNRRISGVVRGWLARRGLELVRRVRPGEETSAQGNEWPMHAETMLSFERLANIRQCVASVVQAGIPGDLIETGVWRGGGTIYMKGILEVLGDRQRTVWVADSFEGLPKPDAEKYPADAGDRHWTYDHLAVSVDQVKANFERYGLLDERVRFLVGWFKDTLPAAPIERLALLRADGDMYESTMDSLANLYDKVSPGGYIIIDDYGILGGCRQAVQDFRLRKDIQDPIHHIDRSGVYWQKT
jgi:O-methyltransferase